MIASETMFRTAHIDSAGTQSTDPRVKAFIASLGFDQGLSVSNDVDAKLQNIGNALRNNGGVQLS